MIYPHIEISPTAIKGRVRVNLWHSFDDVETVYKGTKNQDKLKDALQPILDMYPKIRVRTPSLPSNKPYMHIFRIIEDKVCIRAFAKTHKQCGGDPFKNRRIYDHSLTSSNQSVGFDSVAL